jgi:hypothetical protein
MGIETTISLPSGKPDNRRWLNMSKPACRNRLSVR